MAEIEHFCDPADKSHPKFDSIKDVTVPLYSACGQMDGQLPEMWTFGDAVEKVRAFVCVRPCVRVCARACMCFLFDIYYINLRRPLCVCVCLSVSLYVDVSGNNSNLKKIAPPTPEGNFSGQNEKSPGNVMNC